VRSAVNLSSQDGPCPAQGESCEDAPPAALPDLARFRERPVDILQEKAYVPVVCQKERLMTPPRGEVLQGTLDLIVLQTLHAMGPLHGYGIAQRVQQVSEDLLRLNQGTLYPALLRLEQRGWITSKWGASENNRKAKFYSLTRAGRKQLLAETKSWERMTALMARLLGSTEGA